MSIKEAPVREPIQPMPPSWAIWFQQLTDAINGILTRLGILNVPSGEVVYGSGSGLTSSPDLTFDGTQVKAPQAHFGSGTDYSTFEADGTLRFYGNATVWNDINTSVIPILGGAAVPATIAFNGDAVLKCIAFSGTNPTPDELPSGLEVLHGYKEGTDIRFHIHWYPTDNNSGDVKWKLVYTWFDHDTVPPASTTVTSIGTVAANTAWLERATTFVISGTGKHMGSRFVYALIRDPTDPQDTYAHYAAVTDLGVHYEIDTVGSHEVLVK